MISNAVLSNLLLTLHGLEPVDPMAEIPSAGKAIDAASGLMDAFAHRFSSGPEWDRAGTVIRDLRDDLRSRERRFPELALFLHERSKKDLLGSLRALGLLPPKGEPVEAPEHLLLRLGGVSYLQDVRTAIDTLALIRSLQDLSAEDLHAFRQAGFSLVDYAVRLVPEFGQFFAIRGVLRELFEARTRGEFEIAGRHLEQTGLIPQKGETPDQALKRLQQTGLFFRQAAFVGNATETSLEFLSAVSEMIQFRGEALPDSIFVEVNRRLVKLTRALESGESGSFPPEESSLQAMGLRDLLRDYSLLPKTNQNWNDFWSALDTACLEHAPTLEFSPASETLPPPSPPDAEAPDPVVRETPVERGFAPEVIGARKSFYQPHTVLTKGGWVLYMNRDGQPWRARPYSYRMHPRIAPEERRLVTSSPASSFHDRAGGPSLTPTPVFLEFWRTEQAFRRSLDLYRRRLRPLNTVARILNTGYGLGEEGQPVPFTATEDIASPLDTLSAVYFHEEWTGHRWDLQRALVVGIKILRALKDVHFTGVIHQALTPKRIHIAPGIYDPQNGGDIWLNGFEEAEIEGERSTFSGVPGYAPRDMLEISQHTTAPSLDLFAFAAIFYEMLTSRVPFLPKDVSLRDGRNPEELTRMLLKQMQSPAGLRPLQEINPGVPEDLDRLIRRLLRGGYASDPRHWSIETVLAELLSFRERY